LKTENILLVSENMDNLCVKIIDFGFATYINSKKDLNDSVGSLFFMAPEICMK